jgi:Na+/phosphate symporter
LYKEIIDIFNTRKFERVSLILAQKEEIIILLNEKINTQIERTRLEESSPKNTTLYFNILLETKDLVNSIMNLMDEYFRSYKK